METYAERLKKKEEAMTNYDTDEKEFEILMKKRYETTKKSYTLELGKDEEPWTAINIEIPNKDFLTIARQAHTRDITVNKMVNIMIKYSMKDIEYRYEHNDDPQFLTEDI